MTDISSHILVRERRLPIGRRLLHVVLMTVCLGLTACGGGGGGGEPAPAPGSSQAPSVPSAIATTVISGKATYARVPHDRFTNGLLYAFTYNAPIRGAVIELVARDGSTLQSSITSDQGDYQLTTAANQDVSIRVKAQLRAEGLPSWDMKVVDNTRGAALYTLTSGLFTTAGDTMIQNISAPSGWTGNDYTEERAAAPFAILDTVFESIQQFIAVNNAVEFPPLELNWSVDNRPAVGSFADGEIGNSLFRPSGGGRKIYIMGAANADTDEYDEHIIAHEFTHYVHYHFGRTDSMGGNHSVGDRLDPRLAFGEGLATAFAAVIVNDSNVIDTLGFDQQGGVNIDIESNALRNRGWYNEGSVQAVLYDLYDEGVDGIDTLELGFAPLYETLTGPLRTGVPFVTIHSFLDALKTSNPGAAEIIDELAAIQEIHTQNSDPYGAGETNSAARFDRVLPIYTELPLDGSVVNLCTLAGNLEFGTGNKLSNRRFLKFSITNPIPNVATVITATGPPGSDPDLVLHRNGTVQSSLNAVEGTEKLRRIFTGGDYVLEVYDYTNTTDEPFGNVCFDLSVSVE